MAQEQGGEGLVASPAALAAMGATAGTPGIDFQMADYRSQMSPIQAKERATVEDFTKKSGDLSKQITSEIDAAKKDAAKGPQFEKPPEAPKFSPTDIQNGMGVMLALAAFSGMASRQPLTASLNAMAGLIEGVKAGDDTRFQRSYKEFEANFKTVQASNENYLRRFNAIMDNHKLSLEEKKEQARLLGVETQNTMALNAIERGDIQGAVDLRVKLQTLKNSADKVIADAARYKMQYEAQRAYQNRMLVVQSQRIQLQEKQIAAKTAAENKYKLEAAKLGAKRMDELAKLDTIAEDKMSPASRQQSRQRIEDNYRAALQSLQGVFNVESSAPAEAAGGVDVSDLPPGFEIEQPGG